MPESVSSLTWSWGPRSQFRCCADVLCEVGKQVTFMGIQFLYWLLEGHGLSCRFHMHLF